MISLGTIFNPSSLPPDTECRVLFLVFSYLTTVELCGVSRVSRKWYMVSSHPLLWTTVNISETVLPNQVCGRVVRAALCLRAGWGSLSGIDVWCCCLCVQVLHNLSQRCTQTERLTLHGTMCVCVCMYVCMCVCMYVCVCVNGSLL